jgi:hypothetical protein
VEFIEEAEDLDETELNEMEGLVVLKGMNFTTEVKLYEE